MTSTNPQHIEPGPNPTKKDTQTLGSMALLVLAILLSLAGVVLTTLGIAPALALVVVGVGLGIWSRRAAKRVDPS
jgi:hypothetical protein